MKRLSICAGLLVGIMTIATAPAMAGPYEAWKVLRGNNGRQLGETCHVRECWRDIRREYASNPQHRARGVSIWGFRDGEWTRLRRAGPEKPDDRASYESNRGDGGGSGKEARRP